jgi:hypothetical protein
VLIELHEHRHPELLDNLVAGHGRERGRMSVSDIVALYSAPRAPKIAAPVILLRISRLWYPAMSADALYEATRGWWAIGERRNKADHACAVSRGVVREVYRIHRWRLRRKGDPGYSSADVRPRWGFEGAVSTELRELRNTDVTRYFSQGNSNPVRYVNC